MCVIQWLLMMIKMYLYKYVYIAGVEKLLPSFSKSITFDPIKQHRHFCPWIFSTGKSATGWQQTLAALEECKELTDMPWSTSIEVKPIKSNKCISGYLSGIFYMMEFSNYIVIGKWG